MMLVLQHAAFFLQSNRSLWLLFAIVWCTTFVTPTRTIPSPPQAPSQRYGRRLTAVTPLPIGLKNQSKEESQYLKLHKCRDVGEAYSASYLITKEHLLYQFTGYNLTWVNCEMGSFIMMNQRAHPDRNVNGSVTQTLDILDFSIIHLSWYGKQMKNTLIQYFPPTFNPSSFPRNRSTSNIYPSYYIFTKIKPNKPCHS